MDTEPVKEKKFPRVIGTVLVILSMLAGIALLLYPTVADKINDYVNQNAIGVYQSELQKLDDSDYRALLKAVKEYNADLFETAPYISTLTSEKKAVYQKLLDVAGNGMMGYIEIAKTNVYLPIYHGTSESVLQTGAGHLEASSLPVPGESVHTVLSGHSGLPSARLFTDLDQLRIGDTFKLHILRETLTYRVEKIERVSSDNVNDLWIKKGQELCTLMTCTPYGVNTHRLLITGRRIPTASASANASDKKPVASKWNLWFVLLPAFLLVCIIVAVVIYKKKEEKTRFPLTHTNPC